MNTSTRMMNLLQTRISGTEGNYLDVLSTTRVFSRFQSINRCICKLSSVCTRRYRYMHKLVEGIQLSTPLWQPHQRTSVTFISLTWGRFGFVMTGTKRSYGCWLVKLEIRY